MCCSRCTHLETWTSYEPLVPDTTCSVPVTPEEHKKMWSFLGDDDAVFYDPLYLTFTCSEFARGVQDYGFSWKMTSG